MNLILSQGSVKLKLFEKLPVSSSTQALVYENRNNEYLVIKNGDQAAKSEIKLGKFHTVYRVNTGVEDFSFEKEYPSKVEIEEVRIKFNLTIKVIDPQRIVETKLNDPRLKIENDLDLSIKKVTRAYSVSHLTDLEDDLNELIYDSSLKNKLAARGLEIIEIATLVSSSNEKIQHLKDLEAINKTTAYIGKEKESQETLTTTDRERRKRDLMHVREVHQEAGYAGALVVFQDDEKMLAILREVYEQEQMEKDKKERHNEARQEEREKYAKRRLEEGASADEVKEEIETIETIRDGKVKVAPSEENPEKLSTDEEKLKAKMKKFEESGR